MSRYKRYPTYKDSGNAWVREVPAHWDVMPLRVVASVNDDERDSSSPNMEEIRYVDISTVSLEDGIGEPAVITAEEAPSRAQRKAKVGDVVLSTVRTYLRAIGQVKAGYEDCIFSTGFAVIRPGAKLVDDFLYAAILSEAFLAEIEANSEGVSYPAINAGDVMRFKLPVPPREEQEIIACVLANETARIDALVEKKTRFIELLREKCQALITHAVTKGLDPNVKMKDSGVELLGDVPEHWEVKRLRYLCSDVKAGPFGSSLTKDMYASVGYRVYGQEQVIPGDFDIGDYFISNSLFEELRQYEVRPGDILVSCVGTFGKIAVVPPNAAPGIINPRLLRLRVNELISPDYLGEVLKSPIVFEQFSLFSRGGTMDVINVGTLSSIVLPVPSEKEEQMEIVSKITEIKMRFDALIEKTERSIELLKERRSALITAAVTGQIDLREPA